MKDQEFMVQKIRSQYTEREHTELDALKALDAKAKKPAKVYGYTYGSIGTIVMGAGMSLVMTDIGDMLGMSQTMLPGICLRRSTGPSAGGAYPAGHGSAAGAFAGKTDRSADKSVPGNPCAVSGGRNLS